MEARSRNQCGHRKTISIIYFECVSVALVIKHFMRMRCIILDSVACPAAPCIPHLINGAIFGRKKKKKCFESEMCVLIFSRTLFETFLIFRRNQGDVITNVYRSARKVPVIVVKV